MALVNVNRNNPDVFYRYKMPRLIAKVEGKGNGIKTVIENMPDIAKALYRPPTYPTKYFGCELGAQTQFDAKHDRFIVNGAHEAEKLQDLLDGFIRKFVLCPECENPETVFNVHPKAQTIGQKCQACGYNSKLDMRHKLTTFMLRNPPEGPTEGGVTRKPKKATDSQGDGNEDGTDDSKEQGDVGNGAECEPYEDEDDVDWGEDTSDEAQKARMKEISSAAAALTISDDMEKTPQERADLFLSFVQLKKKASGGNPSKMAAYYKAIVMEADRLEMRDKAVLILAEVLLTANLLQSLKDHRKLFILFTHNNSKAQKHLLGAFEQLVGTEFKEQLMGKVPAILKCMYDLDLVDEETFIEWGKKVSKKYVSKEIGQQIHSRAAPFIKWLQEADEESSEEEDEAVEVEFTHAKKVGLEEKKPDALSNGSATTAAAVDEDDEDDDDEIDLDNI